MIWTGLRKETPGPGFQYMSNQHDPLTADLLRQIGTKVTLSGVFDLKANRARKKINKKS